MLVKIFKLKLINTYFITPTSHLKHTINVYFVNKKDEAFVHNNRASGAFVVYFGQIKYSLNQHQCTHTTYNVKLG